MGGQSVSKLEQLLSRVFSGIRNVHSMMQMDFDLAPAIVTMFSEPPNQPFIMLLSWIEVGVTKRAAVRVTPRRHRLGILLTPGVHATHLLGVVDIAERIVGVKRRLEVIRHSNDEVQRPG